MVSSDPIYRVSDKVVVKEGRRRFNRAKLGGLRITK